MNWGQYQRECHRLMDELFDDKKQAYDWLYHHFKIRHFSDLTPKEDGEKLEAVYNKLYIKSVTED